MTTETENAGTALMAAVEPTDESMAACESGRTRDGGEGEVGFVAGSHASWREAGQRCSASGCKWKLARVEVLQLVEAAAGQYFLRSASNPCGWHQ